MTFATIFSGVEGAGMGLEQAGMDQLWACERDKYCRGVLAYNYPRLKVYEDVTRLDANAVEVPDVLWMSPPCQDLSVAGKRKGLAGERSGLFYVATRIADALVRRGTRYVVMEQVPGLLSSHSGEDFRSVLQSFLELGAVDIGWRVLDSQWFGVPQRRKRMYFVLDFGGKRAGEILALAQGLRGDAAPKREKGEVAGTFAASGAGGNRPAGQANEGDFVIVQPLVYPEVMPTFMACGAGGAYTAGRPGEEGYVLVHALQDTSGREKHQNGLGIGGNLSYTMDATGLQGVAILNPPKYRVRRMTPLEYERGQGFPDYWTRYMIDAKGQTIEVSDAQRYKMCGNAVTTPVAKWIGQRIVGGDAQHR